MTTKDEALRKALEALELLVDVDGRQTEQALDYGDNAIAAIREALAQAEHQSTADKSKLEKVPAKGTLLAQPQQEPVAWLDGPHLVMREDWRDRSNYKGPYVGADRAIPDSWVPVLYTTPPQRKPLTRERLVAMADIPRGVQTFDDWVELFGREIEAAHGITGDKK